MFTFLLILLYCWGVITRLSSLFLRTLRDDPADAEIASHKLLVRAGYIRRVAPGVYSLLPLGLAAVRGIENIVREEMNGIGAQEISLPGLLPREPYERTGRWTEYGDGLFRLKDRKGNDMLLGPTHEELFTSTVKAEFTSYKDLPVTLYQIQTKFRDEERPRAGILRGREFIMKDSYSFSTDQVGLDTAYQQHRDAYQRIFDRLGIEYVICQATSGAMGGSASEEFLAVSPAGEDTFVRSTGGDYVANAEAVITPAPAAVDASGVAAASVVDTPDCTTIDALVTWAQENIGPEISAAHTLKTIVLKTRQPGEEEFSLLAIGIPGDREIDDKRLEAALEPAELAMLNDDDFAAHPFLVKGYMGPKALIDNEVPYFVDPRISEGSSWIVGADEPGKHMINCVAGRDFAVENTIEAAEVREGDLAPDGGTLTLDRGIEIGHIFQLGTKYTEAFDFTVLGENGKPVPVTMGSYGIGVTRLLGVIAEQYHDDKGLKWPAAVAPCDVHVVVANKDQAAVEGAEQIVSSLDAARLNVLFDDRKASPGVKFKDSELLGMPLVVVIGRGWADGTIEIRHRATGESEQVAIDDAVEHILGLASA